MRPKDCAYIVEHLSVRFMAMVADHSRQLAEHRAAFGARTEADAKIIAGLRSEIGAAQMAVLERDSLISERDGLLTQVQDMRAEITRITGNHDLIRREYDKALTLCETDEQTPAECIGSLNARIDRLQDDARSDARVHEELHRINVELRAEVAALKSQTPKEHPVKVGEWVRRLVPSPACDVGTVAKVVHVDDDTSEIEYDVKRIDGQHGVWFAKNCEPCDPPEAMHAEPDLTHLHIKGKEAWSDVPNATQWVEEMRGNTEAAHDTDAGKAVAESAAQHSAGIDIGTWSRKVTT